MITTNNLNGYYLVDGEIIENKMYAILKASEKNTTATWCYYDKIYEDAIKKFDALKKISSNPRSEQSGMPDTKYWQYF